MKRFARLFQQVDATPSTNAKVAALAAYFQEESPHNAVWALYLLMGKTRKRLVTSRILRDVYLSISEIPEWLFEECYAQVGDSAEVIALLLQQQPELIQSAAEIPLAVWMEEILPKVKTVEQEDDLQRLIVSWWRSLQPFEAFILNKLLTGAFRFGASAKLVIKGLAAASSISEPELAHRLMGDFAPTVAFYQQLVQEGDGEVAPSRPYPFFLASSLEEDRFVEEDLSRWQAEWKWDGIRAQLIRRADESFIWSRGEDLITHQFPELADSLAQWPNGTVLDGEILCWAEAEGDRPMNFNALQKRLGRKRVTAKTMAEYPVCFMAYDLLEQAGQDLRTLPLSDRRSRLLGLLETIAPPQMRPSETLSFATWREIQTLRERSRDRGAEGLMLKALDSPYLVGRKRGHWWKYKVEPMTLDAVLIYAQAGSGKRANLFTDYTFALWQDTELVTFAKAYSGLDNKEIDALDKWIRQHTIEKFGPVRAVEPIQVFEIGFEGIAESKRHKSGVSVRFPRILRWRTDKPAAEADTLTTARQILAQHG